ncbi:MAG: alpha-amylase family glycosyl hydrolase [Prevotella sp.]|nr:alpha-amylase family glycosyl hydrolase [Prevotella sp.]
MMSKITIYQTFPRLFNNANPTCKKDGTLAENGSGKFVNYDERALAHIHQMGFTHIWYTGVIRHATQTDYSAYGIPRQHPEVVKGKAGSPYAIVDYYDVDPDLAVNVRSRMAEWEGLIQRTHEADMKVLMDFVPNHVGREYKSICKPQGVRDIGEDDDPHMNFSPQNNFYYCGGAPLNLDGIGVSSDMVDPTLGAYREIPAKATGNDRFDACPSRNDWYETIKLNYGIDYCDAGGRSYHFDPIPNLWGKMVDILLYWASKGVDGFRCDMCFMVPTAFWSYAIKIVKQRYPNVIFIGEMYDTGAYASYIASGFDYLYDKVGMYDCIRGIICGQRPAASITYQWQQTDRVNQHMLYFLENHDEQRIASDFFAGDPEKAIPGAVVSILMRNNPFMLYNGQEYGERGMDEEGFSGRDGRTTIFDYWSPETLRYAYHGISKTTPQGRNLAVTYHNLLNMAVHEKAFSEGEFFDLMYVNPASPHFDPHKHYAFLRKYEDEVMLVIVNFSGEESDVLVTIPAHAFEMLHIPQKNVAAADLLTGDSAFVRLAHDGQFPATLPPYGARIYKFNVRMVDKGLVLNEHNKDEFPPAHTAEHLLNQLMIRMFGCERSRNAHIERKKSKITYHVDHKPTRQEEKAIETEMNRLIDEDMTVSYEFVDRNHVPPEVSLDRLPGNASEMVRLVRIGDYDVCPCLGKHVRSTSQIGKFVLLGTNWNEEKHEFRIRYKVIP